jgi:hypothetical protein
MVYVNHVNSATDIITDAGRMVDTRRPRASITPMILAPKGRRTASGGNSRALIDPVAGFEAVLNNQRLIARHGVSSERRYRLVPSIFPVLEDADQDAPREGDGQGEDRDDFFDCDNRDAGSERQAESEGVELPCGSPQRD